jgi:hypothetical protein
MCSVLLCFPFVFPEHLIPAPVSLLIPVLVHVSVSIYVYIDMH